MMPRVCFLQGGTPAGQHVPIMLRECLLCMGLGGDVGGDGAPAQDAAVGVGAAVVDAAELGARVVALQRSRRPNGILAVSQPHPRKRARLSRVHSIFVALLSTLAPL